MRYNDLPEQCKTCQNLRTWVFEGDMDDNHLVSCEKGSWRFYTAYIKCHRYEENQGDKV